MLYLVEGLNCAGKSTYINEHKKPSDVHLITDFANPLRFGSFESGLSQSEINAYLLGFYKTIFHMIDYLDIHSNDIWWDRTFISAYAYGSIDLSMYMNFLELYRNSQKFNVEIIYLVTSVKTCTNRWIDKMKDRPYVSIKTATDWIGDNINLRKAVDIACVKSYGIQEHKGE